MYRAFMIVLCLAAAGGLGFAAFSERWLENKKTLVRFSLLSSTRCVVEAETTACESKSNALLMTALAMQGKKDASMAFATAGRATLGLSLLRAMRATCLEFHL